MLDAACEPRRSDSCSARDLDHTAQMKQAASDGVVYCKRCSQRSARVSPASPCPWIPSGLQPAAGMTAGASSGGHSHAGHIQTQLPVMETVNYKIVEPTL